MAIDPSILLNTAQIPTESATERKLKKIKLEELLMEQENKKAFRDRLKTTNFSNPQDVQTLANSSKEGLDYVTNYAELEKKRLENEKIENEENRKKEFAQKIKNTNFTNPEEVNNLLNEGKEGLDYVNSYNELLAKQKEIQKKGFAILAEAQKASKEQLDNVYTPEQYIQWIKQNFNDPVLADYAKSRGITEEQTVGNAMQQIKQGKFNELLKTSALGLEKSLEQIVSTVNVGDKEVIVSIPKYANSPKSGAAQEMSLNINKPLTEGQQKNLEDKKTIAKTENKTLGIIRDIKQLLPFAYTGMGASAKLKGAKLAKLIGQPIDSKSVNATERLESLLNTLAKSDIKSSGLAGGHGLSDKELPFLLKSLGASISLERSSIEDIVSRLENEILASRGQNVESKGSKPTTGKKIYSWK